jgi:hypothetical protein
MMIERRKTLGTCTRSFFPDAGTEGDDSFYIPAQLMLTGFETEV